MILHDLGIARNSLVAYCALVSHTASLGSRHSRRVTRCVVSATTSTPWERRAEGLAAAIVFERRLGFTNARGASLSFHLFAVKEVLSFPRRTRRMDQIRSKLVEQLRRYPTMEFTQRRQLVNGELVGFLDMIHRAQRQDIQMRAGVSPDHSKFSNQRQIQTPSPVSKDGLMSREELRSHPQFLSLPSIDDVIIRSAKDFQRLRQDTDAWRDARKVSQVSASTVWKILGFAEEQAACKLGIAKNSSMIDHEISISAWKRACDVDFEEDFSDVARFRMDWGVCHEPRAIHSLLCTSSGRAGLLQVVETGMHLLDDQSVLPAGLGLSDLPVISASPDGFIRTRLDLLSPWSSPEVIEVKCRCPYQPVGTGWVKKKLPPQSAVQPHQFAQIQFQLLCTNADLGYLVSFVSPDAWRMLSVPRNDTWLDLALSFIHEYYQRFILPKTPPPVDYFNSESYGSFLRLTRTLSSQAALRQSESTNIP
mmetsp:Transcript_13447/g.27444  ORF Transcript_13447/g.27444 Transcript_13447/m.27444 type:complete len:478 (-) Transcript_13447:26-1459(-)